MVALSAGLGPSERYRRWLAVLRGDARLVIGTRSAVFAPVADLGLVLMWDDGDDSLSEPRAPYPHAREVAMLRAHQLRCAALIGGYARTAEAQALVRSGWAHDLVAARPDGAGRSPRVLALDDSAYAQERDPAARTARLPSMVLGAARTALKAGAGTRSGAPARLRAGAGVCPVPHHRPMSALHRTAVAARRDAAGAVCRWCGRDEPSLRCARAAPTRCARRGRRSPHRRGTGPRVSRRLRGHLRRRRDDRSVPARPAVVVATPGAEPAAEGGYGAALLLDSWALLGRQDLRAAEDTLRRWMAAAALVRSRADGGVVAVVAESAIPTVQALIRWDPVGHADAELDARAEVGLPPAVHMAAVDGAPMRSARCWVASSARRGRPAGPGRSAVGGSPAAGWPTGIRSAGCWPSAARRRAGAVGGAAAGAGCRARAMIMSRFACRSIRCT